MKVARLTLTALFLGAMACSSVQTVRNPAQFFETTRPQMVVVTYHDNGEVPIAQPTMRGDTIVGTWWGLGEPVSVAMSEVQRIDAVQKDSRKTTAFVLTLVGVGAVTAYGLSRAAFNSSGVLCDYARTGGDDGTGGINDTSGCYRIR